MNAHLAGALARKPATELELRVIMAVWGMDGRACSEDELISRLKGKRDRKQDALQRLCKWGVLGCTERGQWFVRSLDQLGRDAAAGDAPAQEWLPAEDGLGAALRDSTDLRKAPTVRPSAVRDPQGDALKRIDWGEIRAAANGRYDVPTAAVALPQSARPHAGAPPAAGNPPAAANPPAAGICISRGKANESAFPAAAGISMTCKRHASSSKKTCFTWEGRRQVSDELTAEEVWALLMRALAGQVRCADCLQDWRRRIMEDGAAVLNLAKDALNARGTKGPGWFNDEYLIAIGVKVRGGDGKTYWPNRVREARG